MRHKQFCRRACGGGGRGGGCGDDSDEPVARRSRRRRSPRSTSARTPREITCADVADPVSRRVTVALADELLADNAKYAKGHNRLQASQSIFLGITELCKTHDASFKPADEAVRGVETGKWEAKL